MFDTPILFLVFNRPDTTKQVFAKIREIQPKQLFIAADGPRINKEGEKEKTEAVRELILNNIDWDCEVKTLFRDSNLGCGKAVSEGITWFFENVEEGIILEDDTLPDLSFFPFCEELLERYKDEDRVGMITGFTMVNTSQNEYSYTFQKGGGHVWGWASWRRAWQSFDLQMKDYEELKNSGFFEKLCNFDKMKTQDLINLFDTAYYNQVDTWDIQWNYSITKNNWLTIWVYQSLVQNIGFGEDATHTLQKNNKNEEIIANPIQNPLVGSKHIIHDEIYEKLREPLYQGNSPKINLKILFNKFYNKVKSL